MAFVIFRDLLNGSLFHSAYPYPVGGEQLRSGHVQRAISCPHIWVCQLYQDLAQSLLTWNRMKDADDMTESVPHL